MCVHVCVLLLHHSISSLKRLGYSVITVDSQIQWFRRTVYFLVPLYFPYSLLGWEDGKECLLRRDYHIECSPSLYPKERFWRVLYEPLNILSCIHLQFIGQNYRYSPTQPQRGQGMYFYYMHFGGKLEILENSIYGWVDKITSRVGGKIYHYTNRPSNKPSGSWSWQNLTIDHAQSFDCRIILVILSINSDVVLWL